MTARTGDRTGIVCTLGGIRIGGLDYQNTLIQDPNRSSFLLEERAVQVIHMPGHWQVLTRTKNKLEFFCSLGWVMAEETKRLTGHLIHKKEGDRVDFTYRAIQKQSGGTVCGLMAIAITTAFVSGQDPADMTYEQSQMRPHFDKCCQNQELSQFPPAKRPTQIILCRPKDQASHFKVPKLWHVKMTTPLPPKKKSKYQKSDC